MADPIADWRARRTQGEPLESVESLKGTVFDDSDPIAQWRRVKGPDPTVSPTTKRIGAGFGKFYELASDPLVNLDRYADPLVESAVNDTRPAMRALKGFGGSLLKTVAGFSSPMGMASFASGPIGTVARAGMGAEQVASGAGSAVEGAKHGDWGEAAKGGLETALGALMLHEPARAFGDPERSAVRERAPISYHEGPGTGKLERTETPGVAGPQNELEALFDAAGLKFQEPPTVSWRQKPVGVDEIPEAPTGRPTEPDLYGELLSRLENPSAPIEGQPAESIPPPKRPLGLPAAPRFYAGAQGIEDALRDQLNPASAMDAANRPPPMGDVGRPLDADLIRRDISASNRTISPAEYLSNARLEPGDPLAELEATLYPEAATSTPSQGGLNPLAQDQFMRPSEASRGRPVQEPAASVGPVVGRPEGPRAVNKRTALANLSPGEQQGIDALDELERAISGSDEPATRGNGQQPAAPAGDQPGGNLLQQPAADAVGMESAGRAARSPRERRPADTPATRQRDIFDELIADARAQGYTGDEGELRGMLDERTQLLKEIYGETAGPDPHQILRDIAELGGIGEGGAYPGEMDWLREFQDNAGTIYNPRGAFGRVKGISGVFRTPERPGTFTTAGLTFDQALEGLTQRPGRYPDLKSPSDLIEAIRKAATTDAPAFDQEAELARVGIKPGRDWFNDPRLRGEPSDATFSPSELEAPASGWGDIENAPDEELLRVFEGQRDTAALQDDYREQMGLAPDAPLSERQMFEAAGIPVDEVPSGAVDMLDTGETQPRLPEAGAVRDADKPTPQFEAPFSLTGEADTTQRELEQSLFGGATEAVPSGAPEPAGLRGPDEPPPQGHVRVYRVEPAGGEAATDALNRGRWFSTDRHLAQQKYDRTAGPGVVKYLDVPEADLAQYQQAAKMAGASGDQALTRLLLPAGEANRAGVFSELPASETPSARGELPANVRDFLVRQLRYTPEEVAALHVDEAIRIGQNRVTSPNAAPKPAAPAVSPIPGERPNQPLPSMSNFDELRGARGQQRVARLKRSAVEPQEPGSVAGAPAPKTPQQRQAAHEPLTTKERESLGLPPETRDRAPVSLRESGSSPRQIRQRVEHMEAAIADPTIENFAKWVRETSGQAERVNEKQLRGGTGTENQMPPKSPGGTYLASDPFGFGALTQFMERYPAVARPVLQAAAGALAGALASGDGHELKGAMYGALIGAGLTPQAARLINGQWNKLLSKSGAFDMIKRQAIGAAGGAIIGTAADDKDPARGALEGAALGFLGGTVTPNFRRQFRYGAMLSGQAQLTNVLGNVGAIGSAAAEHAVSGFMGNPTGFKTAKDIVRSLFDLPKIIDSTGRLAFHEPVMATSGKLENMPATGLLSVPGRIMNAADAVTQAVMRKGGLSPEESAYYAYRNKPLTETGQAVLDAQQKSSTLRELVPFAKTAINLAERGIERSVFGLSGLYAKMPARERAMLLGQVTLGTAATLAGAAIGGDHPYLTALTGPFALDFSAGMAAKAAYGRRHQMSTAVKDALTTVLHGVSPLSNLTDLMTPVKFGERYVASYVPALLRIFNPDTWTGTKRATIGQGLTAEAQSRVPGLAQQMPKAPPGRRQAAARPSPPPETDTERQYRELETVLGLR